MSYFAAVRRIHRNVNSFLSKLIAHFTAKIFTMIGFVNVGFLKIRHVIIYQKKNYKNHAFGKKNFQIIRDLGY